MPTCRKVESISNEPSIIKNCIMLSVSPAFNSNVDSLQMESENYYHNVIKEMVEGENEIILHENLKIVFNPRNLQIFYKN